MITIYDYIAIIFYFIFTLVTGFVFRKFNKNISDYFRGGGSMMWWMSGASAFMVTFSAWTFTGAAGKAYDTGLLVLTMYWGNALVGVFIYFFTAHRFRQMRVITSAEAIKRRYGRFTEQFFVWLPMLYTPILSGLGIVPIGLFVHAVFGWDPVLITVTLGLIITLMAIPGGSWGVVASDFMQLLLVICVTVVVAILTLRLPEVGGLIGLLSKLPTGHFNWFTQIKMGVLMVWVIFILLNSFISLNNISYGGARFLTVKDGNHAKKAALVTIVGMIVGPIIWFIPSLAAISLFPNMESMYPNMNFPNEAAYIAVSMKVLPTGMLGLLLCGIFAATMSSVDSQMNSNAGIITYNFYNSVLRPKASNKELLIVSKLMVGFFGICAIVSAVFFLKYKDMGLFDLVLSFGGPIGFPMLIPLVMGIFIKRTPSWSGYTTVILGTVVGFYLRFNLNIDLMHKLLGYTEPFTQREITDLIISVPPIAVTIVCVTWFFITMFFYKNSTPKYKENVESFFHDMNTPIDAEAEGVKNHDQAQYKIMGWLSIIYGLFGMSFILIPNSLGGRLCFVFCGGFMLAIGGILLYKFYRHKKIKK